MEGTTVYSAVNLSVNADITGADGRAAAASLFTAYGTTFNTWICPSDGTIQDGKLPNGQLGSGNPRGQFCNQVLDPYTNTNTSWTPVASYQGSFGDNYCGGRLVDPVGLPWETPWNAVLAPGQPRIGHNGYWGVNFGAPDGWTPGGGTLRGMFDYRGTQKPPSIASITDGTSNTIVVGEHIPSRAADSNFWFQNGGLAGTTVPLNWNSDTFPADNPACFGQWQGPNTPLGCRFGAAAKGFASFHPGGGNFALCDGSVRFLKSSIAMPTYCALGSRNGGEVVSADAY
jgi:prepilin-type processing-associated H-X9-DG protein